MTGISERDDHFGWELEEVFDEIIDRYGYNFRDYSPHSLNRRITKFVIQQHISGSQELKEKIKNPVFFEFFLDELMVNVTEMFRDPSFFLELRRTILPVLSTYPFLKIWDAGCSSGEEMVSLAILLREEGLLERSRIFATDLSQKVLMKAKEAIFPLSEMEKYSENYKLAGGKYSLSDYYTARYNSVIFNSSLLENVIFYQHNLASDSSFNEFNLIICRNVLIYFNRILQEKVFHLFYNSLSPLGFLAIGKKETLALSDLGYFFDVVSKEEKIYKKNRL